MSSSTAHMSTSYSYSDAVSKRTTPAQKTTLPKITIASSRLPVPTRRGSTNRVAQKVPQNPTTTERPRPNTTPSAEGNSYTPYTIRNRAAAIRLPVAAKATTSAPKIGTTGVESNTRIPCQLLPAQKPEESKIQNATLPFYNDIWTSIAALEVKKTASATIPATPAPEFGRNGAEHTEDPTGPPTPQEAVVIPNSLSPSIMTASIQRKPVLEEATTISQDQQPPQNTKRVEKVGPESRPIRAMFAYESKEGGKKIFDKKEKVERLVNRMVKRVGEAALEAILYDQGDNIEGLCNGNYHQGEKWCRIVEVFKSQGFAMVEVALAGGFIEFLLQELPHPNSQPPLPTTDDEAAHIMIVGPPEQPRATKKCARIRAISAEAKKLASKGIKTPPHNGLSTRRIAWGPVVIHGVTVETGLLEKETHATVREATDYLQGERERWCARLLTKPTGKAEADKRYAYQAKAIRCRMDLRARRVDVTKPGHGIKDSQNPEILARMPSGMSKRYMRRRKCLGVGSPLRGSMSTTESFVGAELAGGEDSVPEGPSEYHSPERNPLPLDPPECETTPTAVSKAMGVLRKVRSLRTLFHNHLPTPIHPRRYASNETNSDRSLGQDPHEDMVGELKRGSSITAKKPYKDMPHVVRSPEAAPYRKGVHTPIRRPTIVQRKGQQIPPQNFASKLPTVKVPPVLGPGEMKRTHHILPPESKAGPPLARARSKGNGSAPEMPTSTGGATASKLSPDSAGPSGPRRGYHQIPSSLIASPVKATAAAASVHKHRRNQSGGNTGILVSDPGRTITNKVAGRSNFVSSSGRPAPARNEKPRFERGVLW